MDSSVECELFRKHIMNDHDDYIICKADIYYPEKGDAIVPVESWRLSRVFPRYREFKEQNPGGHMRVNLDRRYLEDCINMAVYGIVKEAFGKHHCIFETFGSNLAFAESYCWLFKDFSLEQLRENISDMNNFDMNFSLCGKEDCGQRKFVEECILELSRIANNLISQGKYDVEHLTCDPDVKIFEANPHNPKLVLLWQELQLKYSCQSEFDRDVVDDYTNELECKSVYCGAYKCLQQRMMALLSVINPFLVRKHYFIADCFLKNLDGFSGYHDFALTCEPEYVLKLSHKCSSDGTKLVVNGISLRYEGEEATLIQKKYYNK